MIKILFKVNKIFYQGIICCRKQKHNQSNFSLTWGGRQWLLQTNEPNYYRNKRIENQKSPLFKEIINGKERIKVNINNLIFLKSLWFSFLCFSLHFWLSHSLSLLAALSLLLSNLSFDLLFTLSWTGLPLIYHQISGRSIKRTLWSTWLAASCSWSISVRHGLKGQTYAL